MLPNLIGRKIKLQTTQGARVGTVIQFFPTYAIVQFPYWRECFSIIDIKRALGLNVYEVPVEREISVTKVVEKPITKRKDKRKNFSDEEIKYLVENFNKVSANKMAVELEREPSTIRRKIKVLKREKIIG